MRFNLFTVSAAIASLCSASDINANPVERDLEPRATPTPAAPLCAVKGARVAPTIFGSTQISLTVPAQCGALCRSSSLCKSYAVDSTTCYLYLLAVTKYVKPTATGTVTYYDVGCATSTDLCWISGKPKSGVTAMKSSTYFKDNSWTGCSALCKSTSGCKSYTLGTGACMLYSNTVAKNIAVDSKNPQSFWDVNCQLSAANLVSQVNPSVCIPAMSDAHTLYSHLHQQVILTTPRSPASSMSSRSHHRSPHRQISSRTRPTALIWPQWNSHPTAASQTTTTSPTRTTTLSSHYQLLRIRARRQLQPVSRSRPMPLRRPLAWCPQDHRLKWYVDVALALHALADVTQSILNEDYIPLVSKATNQLGPVAQPTASPAASNPLSQNPENMAFPLFYLQAPAGAPAEYISPPV